MGDDVLQEALLLDVPSFAVESEQLLDDWLPGIQERQLSLRIHCGCEHRQLIFVGAQIWGKLAHLV